MGVCPKSRAEPGPGADWEQRPLLRAPAHTMARTVSHRLTERVPYHDIGTAESPKRFRERELQYFQQQAAKRGDKLALAD